MAELDKLMIVTECTKLEYGQINTHSREGCYIHGLSLEGARWDRESGTIERSRPKKWVSALPVVIVKAVPVDEVRGGVYKCPVYKTQHRGPTTCLMLNFARSSRPVVGSWVVSH